MKTVLEGTIEKVFVDEKPSIQVRLVLMDARVWTGPVEAYPVPYEELKKMVGRQIRLTTQMEFLDEPSAK